MGKNNPEDKNVVWHKSFIERPDRNRMNSHKSGMVWFTGLSASGKSTIAHLLEKKLHARGIRTYVLDGDNVRHGMNSNLGFSPEDRKENLRRIAEMAKLFVDAGIFVLAAFISPFKSDRDYIRQRFSDDTFLEVYVKCSIEECERRDPKGLYKKARAGIIQNYTGISSPYEEPENPELIIDADNLDIEGSAELVIDLLDRESVLPLDSDE